MYKAISCPLRKLLVLAAFGMIASAMLMLASPAFGSTATLKIEAQQGSHEYTAYRLFDCTVNDDDTISDVSLSGCMPEAFYKDAFESSKPQGMAEEVSAGVTGADASAYAVKLSKAAVTYEAQATSTSLSTGEEKSLDCGLYLLVSHDAQPILAVLGSKGLVVSEKSTVPSVKKEVGKQGGDGNVAYGSYATWGVNQKVFYRVTGTLPSNYGAFDTYAYAFVDTLDSCLTPDLSTVGLSLQDSEGKTTAVESGYTATFENGVLRVAFADLKAALPSATYTDSLVLTYQVSVDPAKARFGFKQGNQNKVAVEYRRSPSYEETGTTPESTTAMYTFSLSIVKKSASGSKLLQGAVFSLKDSSGNELLKATTDADGLLTFAGLDAGTYTLTETKAPKGYEVLAKPITVVLKADAEAKTLTATAESDAAKVKSVDANSGVVKLVVSDKASVSSSDSDSGDLPRTSDIIGGALLVLLIMAAAALAGVAVLRRKRDKGQGER